MNPIVKMIALMIKVIIRYLKWINPSKTKLAKKIKIQILIYQKKNLLKFQLKIVIINQIKKMSKWLNNISFFLCRKSLSKVVTEK
jgi:hypothetical protein